MRKILNTTIILCCVFSLHAQEEVYKPELSIDLGITDCGEIFNYGRLQGLYTINLEYKPLSYLGLGGQLSYGGIKLYNSGGSGETKFSSKTLGYAVFAKLYLTPLFTKIEDPKVTVYLKGKIGGLNFYPLVDHFNKSNNFEYGAYLGLRYSPIKRIAFYGEMGYAKYSFSQGGITVKLSK